MWCSSEPRSETKGFQVFLGHGSAQAARDLTAGMPLSRGMCRSLRAAHSPPLSPQTCGLIDWRKSVWEIGMEQLTCEARVGCFQPQLLRSRWCSAIICDTALRREPAWLMGSRRLWFQCPALLLRASWTGFRGIICKRLGSNFNNKVRRWSAKN